MKFEIEDKELARQLAEIASQSVYDSLSRDDYSGVWYNREVSAALYDGIRQIVSDNKEKIINAIIEKAAEKLSSKIQFAAVLAALGGNK